MKSGGSPGEMLADITLFAIAHFPDPGSASDGQQEKALDIDAIIQRHFSGDATLFEVACYVLFRIDLWHFENDFCELREEMGDYLAERFAAVFRQALPKVGVEVLMEHRLREYAALVRADDPARNVHRCFMELLSRTQDNAPPQAWTCTELRGSIVVRDAFLRMALEIRSGAFESAILPAILENFALVYDAPPAGD